MARTALIDGDIYVYQIGSAAETELEWSTDEWTLHAHAGPAKEQLRDKVERLADVLKADNYVVALSSPTNFRKDIVSPAYKGNRSGKRRPLLYACLRQFIMEEMSGFMRDGLP